MKSKFGKIGLPENLHSRHFEGVEYKSHTDILRFFIQNLYLDKLVPKIKSRQIYLKNSILANFKVLNTIWHQFFKVLYLKYKVGEIGSSVIASSNLSKTFHTSQLKDRK